MRLYCYQAHIGGRAEQWFGSWLASSDDNPCSKGSADTGFQQRER